MITQTLSPARNRVAELALLVDGLDKALHVQGKSGRRDDGADQQGNHRRHDHTT